MVSPSPPPLARLGSRFPWESLEGALDRGSGRVGMPGAATGSTAPMLVWMRGGARAPCRFVGQLGMCVFHCFLISRLGDVIFGSGALLVEEVGGVVGSWGARPVRPSDTMSLADRPVENRSSTPVPSCLLWLFGKLRADRLS